MEPHRAERIQVGDATWIGENAVIVAPGTSLRMAFKSAKGNALASNIFCGSTLALKRVSGTKLPTSLREVSIS